MLKMARESTMLNTTGTTSPIRRLPGKGPSRPRSRTTGR